MSNLKGYNVKFTKVTDDDIIKALNKKIKITKEKASLRMMHSVLKCTKLDDQTKAQWFYHFAEPALPQEFLKVLPDVVNDRYS